MLDRACEPAGFEIVRDTSWRSGGLAGPETRYDSDVGSSVSSPVLLNPDTQSYVTSLQFMVPFTLSWTSSLLLAEI